MRLLYALVAVGGLGRLVLLVVRPTAAHRFRQPRRRVAAERIERVGDVTFLIGAAATVVLGGRTPVVVGLALGVVMAVGLGAVGSAHEAARRADGGPSGPSPSGGERSAADRPGASRPVGR